MKRELGISRCGLACCLCARNDECAGCNSGECSDKEWCVNRKCSIDKNLEGCYACGEDCTKGLLSKVKSSAFISFIKKYGIEELLDCLDRNEKSGIIYHRAGIVGDYDDFNTVEEVINFIKTGIK